MDGNDGNGTGCSAFSVGASSNTSRDLRSRPVEELLPIEMRVKPGGVEKVIMASRFDDATAVENGDEIDVSNAREPVRDDEGCPPSGQLVKVLFDRLLGFRIQSARRLVKEDNRWTPVQSTGDGDALGLAS